MDNKSEIKHIIIACCTYKRTDELARLLSNLQDINYPEKIKTEILVVDNDTDESAKPLCEKFSNIRYTVALKKGFASVRNKALEESIKLGATHIAFIDDDEIADENWLINHVDFYNRFEEIYISSGPTIKLFSGDCPEYIRHNKLFSISKSKKTGSLKKTCASGNVFFPIDIIGNLKFNEDFNTSGSEDTDFFFKLNSLGYKIGWNNEAINYEIVNKNRMNIKWILDRAYKNGYSAATVKFGNKKAKKLQYIIKKILSIILNVIGIILSVPFGRTKLLNSCTIFAKNIGKLKGALNLKPIN